MNKYVKDTAITAGISFLISTFTNWLVGPSNDQEVNQEIKGNRVVNIVNEESQEEPGSQAWAFVVISVLILIICVLIYILCKQRKKSAKIKPQVTTAIELEEVQ